MAKHTIDIEGIEDYRFEHLVCSQYGKGSSKKIIMVVTKDSKEFQLDDHGKIILTCKSLTNAVTRYNEIN